ncbi:MAG: hypothetical protein M5U31_00350 [Acidimicrobiia bacterium]|nr:hypothetical protein [Acidimicrobiia bacterium]
MGPPTDCTASLPARNDGAFAGRYPLSARPARGRNGHRSDDLSPEHLFDVLDAVAVRRTRSFIKHYYPHDTIRVDGHKFPITFPTPRG